MNKPILTDVTDNPYFSTCARCGLENIYELELHCRTCGYHLGPASLPLLFQDLPSAARKAEASSVTFQIPFFEKLGCRIQGDGPVVISEIIDSNAFSENQTGQLKYFSGDPVAVRELCDQGLRPQVGDLLVSLNDTVLIHLNSSQVSLPHSLSFLISSGESPYQVFVTPEERSRNSNPTCVAKI
jgi:hypothetical protein